METSVELLRRLGGLQDASIEEVVWCKADRSLRLRIVGPASGVVTFVGIDGLNVETALLRGAFRISSIDVDARDDGLAARVGLSEPASDIHLRCRDIRVTIEES